MRAILKNIASFVLTLLLISFCINKAYAQDPWNAKIMLHSLNGYVDTLWIGCDPNGGPGYQQGLDVIDTTYVTKGGIWGYDPSISAGECFNLKKDIKNFVTGIQTFNLYIADTEFVQSIQDDYLTIDTNDFKFNNGTFKITSVYIEAVDGYIFSIDFTHEFIYIGFDPTFSPIFLYDSVNLIFEGQIYDCLSANDNQMRINMEVGFNYYPLGTMVEEVENIQPLIYPNPVSDNLYIKSKYTFNRLGIIDAKGNYVYSKYFEAGENQYEISTNGFQPGIYMLLIEQTKGLPLIISKIIIIL